jgi:exopolyphosphatase/guanosine-5'-triphosphate,3'-diphosphate pyrophosphatase
MRILSILLACIVLVATILFFDGKPVVRRAAFHIGSGAIRCVVADVNTATQTVVKIIDTVSIKADFAERTAHTDSAHLSPAMIAEGKSLIRQLKIKADRMDVDEFAAVATGILESSRNGPQLIDYLNRELGINARLINTREEAAIGIRAALAELNNPEGLLAIWDIEGSTARIAIPYPDDMLLFTSELASVSFKNAFISMVKRSEGTTPNPITMQDYKAGLALVREEAAKIPPAMRHLLRKGNCPVYGIGPVHNASLPEQMGGITAYTQQDLDQAIKRQLDKTDAQVGGSFAPTQVSNMIYVLGFMQELNIPQVTVLKATIADGLLVSPGYWP